MGLPADVGPNDPSALNDTPDGGLIAPNMLHLFFHDETPWPAWRAFFGFRVSKEIDVRSSMR